MRSPQPHPHGGITALAEILIGADRYTSVAVMPLIFALHFSRICPFEAAQLDIKRETKRKDSI